MSRGLWKRTALIRMFVLGNVQQHPSDITARVSAQFNITRQAAQRHLRRMVEDGHLQMQGKARHCVYKPVQAMKIVAGLSLEGLQEDLVWREHIEPLIAPLPKNIHEVLFYGFTEIMNNAIDHSEGRSASFHVVVGPDRVKITVMDDGVGIFRKITRECNLIDERQALLELTKGKLTTDKSRHSGEGIFFTTRAFDETFIMSGNLVLICKRGGKDWLIEKGSENEGTIFIMEMDRNSKTTMKETYEKFTTGDENDFSKTIIPVSLTRYGTENLVSRSQAKRLLARVDRFREVCLDFDGVLTIGQAFADEIFRVFPNLHPEVSIYPVNASADVDKMIARVRSSVVSQAAGKDSS
jgi:anti-sigma regulatory factor (Ser/Thr protein kinase)